MRHSTMLASLFLIQTIFYFLRLDFSSSRKGFVGAAVQELPWVLRDPPQMRRQRELRSSKHVRRPRHLQKLPENQNNAINFAMPRSLQEQNPVADLVDKYRGTVTITNSIFRVRKNFKEFPLCSWTFRISCQSWSSNVHLLSIFCLLDSFCL